MTLDSRTTRRGWILLAAALPSLVAWACVPKTGRRQTDIMEKAGAVRVSAAVLRARVNGLADRLAGRIEDTSDRIRLESKDREVRRRALVAKIEVIPAVYTAAYRVDPLEAAVDVWALAFQLDQHVGADGVRRDAFGPQQHLYREVARDMLADADAVIESIAVGPEEFAKARARVEHWASTHPMERNASARPSIATYMQELRSERDAFVAVGVATDTLENLSERLNTYAAQLPKQARWQAELLVADSQREQEVEAALDDVHALGSAARRADALLADVPGLVGAAGSPLRELLAAERRAVLEGVNRQRLQTLEYVTAERLATLAAVHEERLATLAALREERVESLKEIDAIRSRTLESALAGLRDLFDYALWRVAALLLFAMLGAATLGVVGYWLTLGRHRAVTAP